MARLTSFFPRIPRVFDYYLGIPLSHWSGVNEEWEELNSRQLTRGHGVENIGFCVVFAVSLVFFLPQRAAGQGRVCLKQPTRTHI